MIPRLMQPSQASAQQLPPRRLLQLSPVGVHEVVQSAILLGKLQVVHGRATQGT